MVPERRSSANSRMVTSGMRSNRMTLMLENSGRSTLSVAFSSRAIIGFIMDCMEASEKNAKIE
jgi:hypothetical protein